MDTPARPACACQGSWGRQPRRCRRGSRRRRRSRNPPLRRGDAPARNRLDDRANAVAAPWLRTGGPGGPVVGLRWRDRTGFTPREYLYFHRALTPRGPYFAGAVHDPKIRDLLVIRKLRVKSRHGLGSADLRSEGTRRRVRTNPGYCDRRHMPTVETTIRPIPPSGLATSACRAA